MIMKKIFIALLAVLMTGGTVQAQSLWDVSHPEHRFTFGVRAGVNFSSTDRDDASSTRTGFNIGVSADWNIVQCIALCSGISYTEKGFKGEYGHASAGYLQVPLQLSYRIETRTGVRFHFNVGPYFAYGIAGRVSYEPQSLTFIYDFHQDAYGKEGFFKHFDSGLTAGVNIQIKKLLFGINYELGMADIARVYEKFHNRNIALMVGLNF